MKNLYTLALLLVGFASTLYSQTTAQTAAEQRARALVQVISSGSRAEAKKFVEANYSDEFLKLPLIAHLGYSRPRMIPLADSKYKACRNRRRVWSRFF